MVKGREVVSSSSKLAAAEGSPASSPLAPPSAPPGISSAPASLPPVAARSASGTEGNNSRVRSRSSSELRQWIVEDLFQCESSDDIDEESLADVFLPYDSDGSGSVSQERFVSIFKSEDLGIELEAEELEELSAAFKSGDGRFRYRELIGARRVM